MKVTLEEWSDNRYGVRVDGLFYFIPDSGGKKDAEALVAMLSREDAMRTVVQVIVPDDHAKTKTPPMTQNPAGQIVLRGIFAHRADGFWVLWLRLAVDPLAPAGPVVGAFV